jgi:hypothetical protein
MSAPLQSDHMRAMAARAYGLAGALNLPIEYLDALFDAATYPEWTGKNLPAPITPLKAIPAGAWGIFMEPSSGVDPSLMRRSESRVFTSLLERVRLAMMSCGAPNLLLEWWDKAIENKEVLKMSIPRLEIKSEHVPQEWKEVGTSKTRPGAFLTNMTKIASCALPAAERSADQAEQ